MSNDETVTKEIPAKQATELRRSICPPPFPPCLVTRPLLVPPPPPPLAIHNIEFRDWRLNIHFLLFTPLVFLSTLGCCSIISEKFPDLWARWQQVLVSLETTVDSIIGVL